MINISCLSILQDFSLTFYLNAPNKRGVGVVYARYKIGKNLYRISTRMKVKKEYWNKASGTIMLRKGCM